MKQKIKELLDRGINYLYKLNEKDTDTVIYTLMCIVTIPALILLGLYLAFSSQILPVQFEGCIFQRALHVYCPGCGGTRAVRALLSGSLIKAFCYHPGAVAGAILYLVFFLSQTLTRVSRGHVKAIRFRVGYLYGVIILIIGNFIIRNILLLSFGIETL